MSLYKRKDSVFWWVKVSVAGLKPIQQSTGTADKQKAEEYEARLKNNLWEQTRLGIKPRYLWQEAVVKYLEETTHKASQQSDIYQLQWLRPHLDNKYIDEINRALVDKLISIRLKSGVTNATVNRCMQLISNVLNKAVNEWEWIDRAPKVRSLSEPLIRVRWLKHHEAVNLLSELPEHLNAMARFALATGLRRGNVVGLEWSQVDLAKRHALIHPDQAKARKAIPVPLSVEAIAVIREQLFKHPVYVFTYKGKPVKQTHGKAWQAALKRSGIDNFRWHDLRHTWASWHVQNGTPMRILQQLGGWHSMEMVQKYAHLSSEHLAPYVEHVSGLLVDDVATNQLQQHAG